MIGIGICRIWIRVLVLVGGEGGVVLAGDALACDFDGVGEYVFFGWRDVLEVCAIHLNLITSNG